jgi:hypothetical protein
MFTPEERTRLRSDLLKLAAADSRISGAAITGSAAGLREDEWSDIDLAFGVKDGAELPDVLSDWTSHMYSRNGALHHVDVIAGAWIYRVFLLANTMQVDLAFVPAREFRALAPSFRLVLGEAQGPAPAPAIDPEKFIGMGWLYALHARSSIARGKLWQANYMINGVRDNALALACLRHGLAAVHARGVDTLPADVTAPFQASLVRSLDPSELWRAFRVVMDGLLFEIRAVIPELAVTLQPALSALPMDELPQAAKRPEP